MQLHGRSGFDFGKTILMISKGPLIRVIVYRDNPNLFKKYCVATGDAPRVTAEVSENKIFNFETCESISIYSGIQYLYNMIVIIHSNNYCTRRTIFPEAEC